MALFFGKHRHSVDSKGRVAIPHAFRGRLSPESEGKIILEPGSDGAISAHPSSEFSKFWDAALPVMTRYQDDSADALRHLAEIEPR